MGSSQSKVVKKTNITSKAISDAVITSTNSCETNANNSQTIKNSETVFSNIKGSTIDASILQQINSKFTSNCIQSSNVTSTLDTQIKSDLDQEVKNRMKGFTAVVTDTDTKEITDLTDEVKKNVNVSTLTKCLSDAKNRQEIDVDARKFTNIEGADIKATVQQSIASDLSTKCVQSDSVLQAATDKLETKLKSITGSEQSGLDINGIVDSVGSVVKSAFTAFSLPITIMLCIGFVLVVFAGPTLINYVQ